MPPEHDFSRRRGDDRVRRIHASPHDTVRSHHRVAPEYGAGKDCRTDTDPGAGADHHRIALVVRLLQDGHVGMAESVIVVADEYPFRHQDEGFDGDRPGAGHEGEPPDLAGMVDRDAAVVQVVLELEVLSEPRIHILPEEAEVFESVDIATFANGDPVANDDILRIENA